jgi:hypothetical protein
VQQFARCDLARYLPLATTYTAHKFDRAANDPISDAFEDNMIRLFMELEDFDRALRAKHRLSGKGHAKFMRKSTWDFVG